ncbi:N-acetyltransferase family protein [Ascoidea rubescens DSM 1968]|uniref:Acyl-CoA N-acyltransferase n=1 Tax=Ascoidea rubescens DSM 1968 TaxID=1344418 RepID=A0A1D2VHG7_9ASCO|nr:acyl-CoA N-acyltransferase [Ascoidea rubescens DSM 1968]ODV61111.1 acyl-CoA N-acyltransferase [Ascoidea rubescens DSM 1968]
MAKSAGFSIRSITKDDKDAWLELWGNEDDSYLTFFKRKLSDKQNNITFERFLDDSVQLWCAVAVAAEDGKLIGFVTYLTHLSTWSHDKYMYLEDLFVSSNQRLSGVGRKLIEYVYHESDCQKCSKIYWFTEMDNHRAQLLYNKVGSFENFIKYSKKYNYQNTSD